MRLSQIMGVILVILGVVLVGVSMHANNEIAQAEQNAKKGATGLFLDAPVVGGAVKEQITGTARPYYEKAHLAFLGGIGIAVVGVLVFFSKRIKK